MSSIEELSADLGELCVLCNQARRPKVKERLSALVSELESEIKKLKAKVNEEKSGGVSEPSGAKTPIRPLKKITTYGWDQSDKFAKIYVTANGVHGLESGQIKCEFGKRSFTLFIEDLNGANHVLEITNLHDQILPADSYHKVKTDNVLVMLKKASPNKSWPGVVKQVASQTKDKDHYKPATEEDPSAGLMSLMKKMYDEGDDEMKRMLNKTWAESRDKQNMTGEMIP